MALQLGLISRQWRWSCFLVSLVLVMVQLQPAMCGSTAEATSFSPLIVRIRVVTLPLKGYCLCFSGAF